MAICFDLTPEQEEIKRQAGEFGEREVLPIAAQIDEKDEMPWDLWRKMAMPPHRYTAMYIPKEYDGTAWPILDICIAAEEITFASQSAMAGMLMEAPGLAPTTILAGGSEEQKKKYVAPVARGEAFGAFGLTEPGVGSDASALETVAEFKNGKYILNGRKRYMSFAHAADWGVVMAKTDPARGARGVSAFVIERGTSGYSVIERVPTMGCRGHQDEEVLLKDCIIPKEQLVGEAGKGLKYALSTLDETRTTLCAGFLGLTRAAFTEAVEYAKTRFAFGHPIGEYQLVSFSLGDIATEIEAARLLIYRAALLADRKVKHSAETASAKAFTSQLLLKATNLAVEVHGGFGCTKRHPVERMFRDARTWVFAQGAPYVQRLVNARSIFPELTIR
ncbi:MAG: acyl-CoA dehydrogenase family protein [Syntrophales bacterium]|nr:acyl-CoA dehydrogenase family protein [Syntrophales bacterium]